MQTDPLPSWNKGTSKRSILDFIEAVTSANKPEYVLPSDRIAVFDNDGTLWCEKPMYIQLDLILRKLAAKAERDPALRSKQPWLAAWEKDFDWLGGAITKYYQGDDSDVQVMLGGILSLAEGQAVEQVEAAAKDFIENERHPTLGLAYRECIYQPMMSCFGIWKPMDSSTILSLGAAVTSCAALPKICTASPVSGSSAAQSRTVTWKAMTAARSCSKQNWT